MHHRDDIPTILKVNISWLGDFFRCFFHPSQGQALAPISRLMARVWGSDSTCKVGSAGWELAADYVWKTWGKYPWNILGGIYGKVRGKYCGIEVLMILLFLVWLDDVGWFWKVCVLMWLDYKDELQQSCCCVSPCKSYVRDSSPQQLKIRFLTEREDYFSSNWYLSSCIESEWEPNPPVAMLTWQKKMKLVWNREIFTIGTQILANFLPHGCAPFFCCSPFFVAAETRKQKWHLNQSLQKKNRRSVEARWKPDASGYGWMPWWNVD